MKKFVKNWLIVAFNNVILYGDESKTANYGGLKQKKKDVFKMGIYDYIVYIYIYIYIYIYTQGLNKIMKKPRILVS